MLSRAKRSRPGSVGRSVVVAALAVVGCLWPGAAPCGEPAGKDRALPEAGGLVELPQETAQAVELVNPGFEGEWAGWVPARQDAFALAAEPGEAHSGRACLRLDCGRPTQYVPSLRQSLTDAGPGVYRLRFWLKLREVGGKTQQPQGARVSIEYLLGSGQRAWPSTQVFRGTRDWQLQELLAHVPPEVKPGSVSVSIHRYGGPGGGQALFDDLTLERLLPPPVEAFLLYPNYRGFLPEDAPGAVRLWVRVNRARPGEPVTIEARSSDENRVVAARTLAPGTQPHVVELDGRPWPPGRYSVVARQGPDRYPTYQVHKLSADTKRRLDVWFDEKGVLHLRGKPVFPLGLYNTTRQFCNRDEDLKLDEESARLTRMTEAGVNANVNYWFWSPGREARRRYLGAMAERGIWFLDTVNNVYPGFPRTPCAAELVPEAAGRANLDTQEQVDRYLARLAELMPAMPAFLGWYVMDERGFADVPTHFHQYRVLRQADPGHPAFGVSDKPAELGFWRDALDVFGVDPYPLMNMKAGRPLSLAGDWTRAAVEATHGSRPVWVVIQFFQGWSTDRWPTAEELRTMSLMAIAEGARGLFYWSYGSRALMSVRDPNKQEEYWQRLVRVGREIQGLEPALVAADAPQLVQSVSDPRVRWRARAADGKCYVFAYVPSEKFVADPGRVEAVEVQFTLAGGRTVRRTLRPDSADWFAVPLN